MEHDTMESFLINHAKENSIPITGSIELLPLCNMSCDMCYVRMTSDEMKLTGSLKTTEEWLNIGRQMAEAGTMFLLLTGGEPLLYPGFRELYTCLQQLGMILTVNTNGTLIDQSWVEFFRDNRPRRINITLYGTDKETYRNLCHYEGGYDKVIEAITLLRQAGIDVKINGSIVKSNCKDYTRIIEIADELHCAVNIDTHMQPSEKERSKPYSEQCRLDPYEAAKTAMEINRLQDSHEEYKKRINSILECVANTEQKAVAPVGIKCLAANCSFSLNWQGFMKPCVMLKGIESNVFDVGFANSWDKIRKDCQNLTLNQKCYSCIYRELCNTCVASAYLETGSYDGVPEYLCQYTEAIYQIAKNESLTLEN